MKRTFYVYILSSFQFALYIGVTNNLERRLEEHRLGKDGSFTEKYKCHQLVYFEEFESINDAIYREKQLKKWSRKKKMKLILSMNPEWKELDKK